MVDVTLAFSSTTSGDGWGIAGWPIELEKSATDGIAITRSLLKLSEPDKPFARGSMGNIVLAQDTQLDRTVVIKVINARHRDDPEMNARFRREAAITAYLQHPCVPPVFGAGILQDGRPFFSMRLIEGKTLAQLLAEATGDRDAQARLLTFFELVCQTVAFAHSKRVIHRDLKPENMVAGEFGSVYVMDWGIARRLDGEPTEHSRGGCSLRGSVQPEKTLVAVPGNDDAEDDGTDPGRTLAAYLLGTPQYMSPEQARGQEDLDERTDVFSLGAILFEILTGEPLRPKGKFDPEALQAFTVLYHATAMDRLAAAKAEKPLVDLVRRCLELDRELRPRDASVVAAEMKAYLVHVIQRPEREMSRFFELSLDLFCIAGIDGFFKQVNRNFSRVLGYTREELLSRRFIEMVHPEDREKTQLVMANLSRGLPVVHFQNRYLDFWGNCKWFEWTAKSVREEGIIFAAARDITERKCLEQRLHAIIESSPVAMVITDQEGLIQQVSLEAERLFGYGHSELVGQSVEVLLPERFRVNQASLWEAFHDDPETRGGAVRELWARRRDGTEIPIELGSSPLETEDGRFVVSVITSSRVRKEQAQWCQAVVESLDSSVIVMDSGGVIRLANANTEQLFGYPRAELVGKSVEALLAERSQLARPSLLEGFLAQPSSRRLGTEGSLFGKTRDGVEFPLEILLSPLETEEGMFVIGKIVDRNDR